jgi:hypothetical protein
MLRILFIFPQWPKVLFDAQLVSAQTIFHFSFSITFSFAGPSFQSVLPGRYGPLQLGPALLIFIFLLQSLEPLLPPKATPSMCRHAGRPPMLLERNWIVIDSPSSPKVVGRSTAIP